MGSNNGLAHPWVDSENTEYVNYIEHELYSQVEPNLDCLDWVGPFYKEGSTDIDRSGREPTRYQYGAFDFYTPDLREGHCGAHVASWELYHCMGVPEGMIVRHECDRARCVNPEHLTVGTYTDNMRDMVIRGRGRSKLTARDVKDIRNLYDEGVCTQKELAESYEVKIEVIRRLIARDTFDFIP